MEVHEEVKQVLAPMWELGVPSYVKPKFKPPLLTTACEGDAAYADGAACGGAFAGLTALTIGASNVNDPSVVPTCDASDVRINLLPLGRNAEDSQTTEEYVDQLVQEHA